MRRVPQVCLIPLLTGVLGHAGWASAERAQWELVTGGLDDVRFRAVAAHPFQPDRLFAGADGTVYETRDGGGSWAARFDVPGQGRVAAIAVGPSRVPTVLLATDQGLYGSFDGGTRWSRVFRSLRPGGRDCRQVLFLRHPQATALVATQAGLWRSPDDGRHWDRVPIPRAARTLVHLAFSPEDPDRLYLVTSSELFIGRLSNGQWQQRAVRLRAEEPGVEESGASSTGEGADLLHHLSAIAVDPQEPATLYLATSRGLQLSPDGGLTWRAMPRHGLISPAISRLLLRAHSPTRLYAATGHGVARYDSTRERWQLLTGGLAGTPVNDLAGTHQALWAATDQGLFRYAPGDLEALADPGWPPAEELLANFAHEPTIAEVQDAAIRYGEVHPDKIRRWRRRANLKALLPTLTAAYNRDDDNFITTRGSTSDPSTDRFLTLDDPSHGVDVSIKWDLGELIWNEDQTSIDVRSKLMVQLRDDLVDEVTRTYFERRRLQVLLLTNPPPDPHVRLEQELRVQELTALIDGLTGGYFSDQVQVVDNL